MTSLIADDAMLAVLRQAQSLAEIKDAQGNVIGFFAPVSLDHASRYAQAAAQVDPATIQQRKSGERRTHSTTDVLKHLDPLERA